MSERRKKAPKIAWRDLGKASDDTPATTPTTTAPAAEPAAPTARARADDAKAKTPPARKARVAKPAPAQPHAGEPVAAPVAAPVVAPAAAPVAVDETSPIALAAKLDAAYAAMVADGQREAANVRGPSIATGIASAIATAAAAPAAPVSKASPASAPAATAEAEVQRILAHLATYVPVPRVAAAPVASPADGDAPVAVIPRGPMPLEAELAPLVGPSGLRDAARTRRGRVELLLFRAGGELFALPLGAVEEAIESPEIHTLPEMPEAMLGVFNLRERLVPTYSPGPSLGVALAEPAGAALLVRSGERRVALAADDVEDVMELDLSTLREPPVVEDTDGILLGVARFSRDLVGILDADALISACLGGRNVETT